MRRSSEILLPEMKNSAVKGEPTWFHPKYAGIGEERKILEVLEIGEAQLLGNRIALGVNCP